MEKKELKQLDRVNLGHQQKMREYIERKKQVEKTKAK